MSEGPAFPGGLPTDGFFLPPELESGVYAEAVAIWHTPFALVIDFLVPLVPRYGTALGEEAQPDPVDQVIARVRLPIGFAFEMIRGVSDMMTDYEKRWGEIHRPQQQEGGER